MCDSNKKQRIEQIEKAIAELNHELQTIKLFCDHDIVKTDWDSAQCDICKEDFGHWCPDSPTHFCDYDQEDGSYDEDCCRYCGNPEERK